MMATLKKAATITKKMTATGAASTVSNPISATVVMLTHAQT